MYRSSVNIFIWPFFVFGADGTLNSTTEVFISFMACKARSPNFSPDIFWRSKIKNKKQKSKNKIGSKQLQTLHAIVLLFYFDDTMNVKCTNVSIEFLRGNMNAHWWFVKNIII